MSNRITGTATIRVDSKEFPTERGATLNPGGMKRTPKMAGRRVYYNEEPVPPQLTASVLHVEELDLVNINNIRDATVLFECDNGQDYMLTGAFVTEVSELNSGDGTLPLTMSARTCERV